MICSLSVGDRIRVRLRAESSLADSARIAGSHWACPSVERADGQ